jgi:precorrin-3B synthase
VAARLAPADADADLAPAVHCTPFYEEIAPTSWLWRFGPCGGALVPLALQQQDIPALPGKFDMLVDDAVRSLGGVASDLRGGDADGGYGLALGQSATGTL